MFKRNSANAFLSLFSLYKVLKDDLHDRGFSGFYFESFIAFGCIGTFGSYGCTVNGLLFVMYRSDNAVTHRGLRYRLSDLRRYGFVDKFYHKGRCRYKISAHAEKLISKSLGKESLRDMASYVRSCLKE